MALKKIDLVLTKVETSAVETRCDRNFYKSENIINLTKKLRFWLPANRIFLFVGRISKSRRLR
ncbi:MAG: hypothetical protein DYH05_12305 [Acidobacteria bacterium ACB1]|nr:hypothetical protein [Acidobacteria bacterium ACB1]